MHASFVHGSDFMPVWNRAVDVLQRTETELRAPLGWMTDGDSKWRRLDTLEAWLSANPSDPFAVSLHRAFDGVFVKLEYVPQAPRRPMYAGSRVVITSREKTLNESDRERILAIVQELAAALSFPQGCVLVEPIGAPRSTMPMYMDWGERWSVTTHDMRDFCLDDSLFTAWVGGIGAVAYWLGPPFASRLPTPSARVELQRTTYPEGLWIGVRQPTKALSEETAALAEVMAPLLVSAERIEAHRFRF